MWYVRKYKCRGKTKPEKGGVCVCVGLWWQLGWVLRGSLTSESSSKGALGVSQVDV